MRILILLDKKILDRKADVNVALERIKSDYQDATPVSWEYSERDFDNLRWVEYMSDSLGIAWDIVYKDMNVIPVDKYDDVIYVVSEENWKAVGFGGWSLGSPINGFQVQLVRIYVNNPDWLYKTFAMEIAHSWNDLTIQELEDNLLSTFGVFSFDNQVIHGADKRYGVNVPDNPDLNAYYTNYDYRPMIAIVKDKLKLAYEKRLTRYTNPIQFKFTKNLYFGIRNNDVLELQKRFVKEGLATYTPTGYFGRLTLASAKAYQIRHAITPAYGFVGIKTRTVLNSEQPEPIELSEIMHTL
ncbi:MAG: peptidoglycan-binding domain-containing protein [Patescibacteria group bacterium]